MKKIISIFLLALSAGSFASTCDILVSADTVHSDLSAAREVMLEVLKEKGFRIVVSPSDKVDFLAVFQTFNDKENFYIPAHNTNEAVRGNYAHGYVTLYDVKDGKAGTQLRRVSNRKFYFIRKERASQIALKNAVKALPDCSGLIY